MQLEWRKYWREDEHQGRVKTRNDEQTDIYIIYNIFFMEIKIFNEKSHHTLEFKYFLEILRFGGKSPKITKNAKNIKKIRFPKSNEIFYSNFFYSIENILYFPKIYFCSSFLVIARPCCSSSRRYLDSSKAFENDEKTRSHDEKWREITYFPKIKSILIRIKKISIKKLVRIRKTNIFCIHGYLAKNRHQRVSSKNRH